MCEYCDKPATTKREVYDAVMECAIEVNVCEECADYIDTENYNKIEPWGGK